MVRPESLHLSAQRPVAGEALNGFSAVVEEVIYFGPHERVRLRAGPQIVHVQEGRRDQAAAVHAGASVWVSFDPKAARVVGE